MSASTPTPKRVTITFDFEGTWGMPHDVPYDLAATTKRLLEVLAARGAKAVFFVTGKLVTQFPEVIREIHAQGHEIGFHGYTHEHMHKLSGSKLADLITSLREVSADLEHLTGYQPAGFRAPYLMGPIFYIPEIYRALADQGFTWISNREIRMPEELFRPDRIKIGMGLLRVPVIRKAALIALNTKLILAERPGGGRTVLSSLKWLLGAQSPFPRPEGLMEFPLTSPLDCDLVGEPLPSVASGAEVVTYATRVIMDCYQVSGPYFNINCHDWITGTMDRLQILDQVLARINAGGHAAYILPGAGSNRGGADQ